MTRKLPKELIFRARMVAAERGYLQIRQIHQLIAPYGIGISESQLGKVLRHTPTQINTKLIAALCTALDVDPGELFSLRMAERSSTKRRVSTKKVPDEETTQTHDPTVAAPKVTPLPARRAG